MSSFKSFRPAATCLILSITTICCYGGVLLDKAVYLSDRLITEQSQSNSREYFAYFPSDFGSFVDLFGYHDGNVKNAIGMRETVFGPLYGPAFKHVEFFFSTSTVIGLDDFADKAIALLIGGYRQSDGVSFLRVEATSHIAQHKAVYVAKLSQLSYDDYQSVVAFLHDTGPCGVDLQAKWITDPVCQANSALCISEEQL